VLSASLLDGPEFDGVASLSDSITAPEVDVSGREVVQALVIASVIVVLDEVGDCSMPSNFALSTCLLTGTGKVPQKVSC
jgi:hypothetical protein